MKEPAPQRVSAFVFLVCFFLGDHVLGRDHAAMAKAPFDLVGIGFPSPAV